MTDTLRRILFAYSVHNPVLGYCQGLNFIAARIMQHLGEEESFWLLVKMIERSPRDYHTTMVCLCYGF